MKDIVGHWSENGLFQHSGADSQHGWRGSLTKVVRISCFLLLMALTLLLTIFVRVLKALFTKPFGSQRLSSGKVLAQYDNSNIPICIFE